MAKAIITPGAGAVVVTSTLKKEQILKLAKYKPDALVLKGGEDGQDEVFKIGLTDKNPGQINSFSAVFGGTSTDGYATLTMALPPIEGDVKTKVAELIGPAILNLNKVEETIPGVLAELDEQTAAILENIEVL